MQLGFETIGNATIIFHCNGPLLTTDPWVYGEPYFGSWRMSHEIPDKQLMNINQSKYFWISHGHPDHLDLATLDYHKDKIILIGNHYGNRIKNDLVNDGFNVKVLKYNSWEQISRNVSVKCIADYNQDSILLVRMLDDLIINTNDASSRGWSSIVKKEISQAKRSFFTCLSGYGDADMFNIYDGNDNFIGKNSPEIVRKEFKVGKNIQSLLEYFGADFFVPTSSFHKYQREDSIWANAYTTKVEDYSTGFDSSEKILLNPFIRFDLISDTLTEINPNEKNDLVKSPIDYGDNWSDDLDKNDFKKIETYFNKIELLKTRMDFITFNIGNTEKTISFNNKSNKKGLIFSGPRNSLMTAIKYKIFDDLLIGNFMKVKIIGEWPYTWPLYYDFCPLVPKYSDNGNVYNKTELKKYFIFYFKRNLKYEILDFINDRKKYFINIIKNNRILYRIFKNIYILFFKIRNQL